MERCLGLMAGAGILPGRAAAEARRQGWRVVAFAFADAPDLASAADRVVPSQVTDLQSVLGALGPEGVGAVAFVGSFAKRRFFAHAEQADDAGRDLSREGLADGSLGRMAVALLGSMGIEVMDQRRLLGPWLVASERLSTRAPSEAEWTEIHEGWRLAHDLANRGVGQTVVRARGVTVAVEAAEGTDEAIRRGVRLSGPGAVVVKAVADDHDFRFDIPTIGLATLETMEAGGASALAVARGRTLVVDHEAVARRADAAGIALVTLEDSA
ncbi:MAG TPA: UDP-2,3-diacylglucosamine diphosphatase LpxI [Verrucomicrobiae bacterium]|nr:UDP-2,3-diacylglucosamine diphosphatase LpxI [Verrucomicrobiae bacterium]